MNQRVQDAAQFIDATLQKEGTWYRADEVESRLGAEHTSYGASVGAVRGTVRDAGRKFKELDHDDVTALASLLWGQPGPGRKPVYECRLAAVVLLQSRVGVLRHTDLTRIERFVRSARTDELVAPLMRDVVLPLLAALRGKDRKRAQAVTGRWQQDPDGWVRRAGALASLAAPGPVPPEVKETAHE